MITTNAHAIIHNTKVRYPKLGREIMLFQDEIVKKSRKKVFRNVFYKQVDYRKVI